MTESNDQITEVLCARGCQYVNQLLDSELHRLECAELQLLNQDQQIEVLGELKKVMAVYDSPND